MLDCDLGTPEGQTTFRKNKLVERCKQYTGKAAETTANIIAESANSKPDAGAVSRSIPRLQRPSDTPFQPLRKSMPLQLSSTIDALFAGGMGILSAESHRSGIFKRPISGQATVTINGIDGDEHADKRVHGGPEKAVHHYDAENYKRLASQYPAVAHEFRPGSIGESISTTGLTEQNVHIGDVFRIGSVVV